MKSNKKNNFSIIKRLHSFKYAFNGIRILFIKEHNARIHIVISLLVIILGYISKVSCIEWLVILVLIGLVLSLEAINSAIEALSDFVSPQKTK